MLRIILFLPLMALIAACNTVQGAGQDLQSAGEAIEQEAIQAQ